MMVAILNTSEGISSHASLRERFLDWLQSLFPLVAILTSPTAQDPARGIALPAGEPPRDASAISAYYLSFYE